MKGFTTKAIHQKFPKKDPNGSLQIPIYDSVAFEFDNSNDIELAFLGKKPYHTYSRMSNPTLEYFEQKIRALTNSLGVVSFSSGMAAISNLFLTVLSSGDNVITSNHLFGNTVSLLEKSLKPWGLDVKYGDLNDPESIVKLIDDKTRLIYFETITNPQLEIVDIEKITKIAKEHNILVVVDSTLTPLYFCDFKKLGVNIEVISSTKYISCGATTLGGVIIDHGNFNWKVYPKLCEDWTKFGPFTFINRLKKEIYRNFGASLSPHNAFLQSVGLETLALRIERSNENAIKVAQHLNKLDKIHNVNYPGLPNNKFNSLAVKQFGNLFGGLITFELTSKAECYKFMDSLQIIRRATNLNDNKTLIIHPSSTIFSDFDSDKKISMDIKDTMLRLSIGIEDSEDIIDDIDQALNKLED